MSDTKFQVPAGIKPGWILFACSILAVMVQVDYTAVNVGIEAMAKSVHTNLTTIQWVLSAYVLAWGSLVLTAGRLADIFGKRRMFLIGVSLFITGSLLSGLATSAWFLIASRIIQGAGGAIYLPPLYTLVFTSFPENKRGMALGVLTAAFAVGMAIGPTLGGVVIHLLDWRWIFFLNAPLGIFVILVALYATTKEPKRLLDEPMDYFGAFVLAGGMVSLMYGLDHIHNWGLISLGAVICLILTILFIGIFIYHQLNTKYPLISLEIFKNRAFLGCTITYVVLGYNFAAVLILGGLYLQNTLDFSALHAGYVFLSMTVTFGLMSVYAGKLADRMDPRIPIIIGSIATIVAVIWFAYLNHSSPMWQILSAFAIAGIGIGLAFPAVNAAMMKSVNEKELNTASGAFTMFGALGNTTGLILSSILLVFFGQQKIQYLLRQFHMTISTNQLEQLKHVITQTHYSFSQLTTFANNQLHSIMDILHNAFLYAMSISMFIAATLAGIGIITVVILIKFPAATEKENKPVATVEA